MADRTRKDDEALVDLRKTKEEDIKRIEKDFKEKPEKLAEEIKNQFGFSHVK